MNKYILESRPNKKSSDWKCILVSENAAAIYSIACDISSSKIWKSKKEAGQILRMSTDELLRVREVPFIRIPL